MAKPITIPKLGLTMRKATIVRWLAKEGEQVAKDRPVVAIETEKVSAEVQSPESGVLLKMLAPRGSVVQVGAVIGFVGQPGEAVPDLGAVQQAPVAAAAKPATVAVVESRSGDEARGPAAQETTRRRVSPRAKMLAEQKGVDLSKVVGTGVNEMIMESDVLGYIDRSLHATSQGLKVKEAIPMSATRKAIAENMVSSLQSMAQVTLTVEAVASGLEKRLQEAGQAAEPRPTYTDILVKIVARALERHPVVNSTLEDDQVKVVEEVNVGVAVAAETGLVVPVVRGANRKSINEISRAIKELAEKARRGALTLEDITGGTFTITNLGAYGVDSFTPIINPPQSAILGVGRISPKPTVDEGGTLVVKPMVVLSLTFDHRVMDGHTAALFLKDLKERVESAVTDA